MKRTFLLLVVLSTTQLLAQPDQILSPLAIPPGPPALAIDPTSPGSLALSPPTNALAITPPSFANPPVANFVTVNQLAPLLTNLEATIVLTLPTLTAFNDEFQFVNGVSGGQQPLNSPGPASGAPMTSPASTANAGIPASGQSSLMVGANQFVLPPGLAGPGTTNGLGNFVLTQDTLRALLVLQNDMERMLPVLDAVNGGTNFVNTALPPGSLTPTTNLVSPTGR